MLQALYLIFLSLYTNYIDHFAFLTTANIPSVVSCAAYQCNQKKVKISMAKYFPHMQAENPKQPTE